VPQKITVTPKGLYTNVNQLGSIPEGALNETLNCVISRPGIIGVRRGREVTKFFASLSNDFWSPTGTPLQFFNAKLRVGGNTLNNFTGTPTPGLILITKEGELYWSTDATNYTKVAPTYGGDNLILSAPTGDRHYYAFEQNSNFYISTASGVIRIGRPLPNSNTRVYPIPRETPTPALTTDEIADLSRSGYSPAGVPFATSTTAVLSTAAGTAINANSQVAYRFAFAYRDNSNIVKVGAPSARATVTNPSQNQTRDCIVSTPIPPGINPYRHFWQLYRSLPSGDAAVDPGDDLGLIAEGSIPLPIRVTAMQRTGTTLTVTSPDTASLVAGTTFLRLRNNVAVPTGIIYAGHVTVHNNDANSTLRTIKNQPTVYVPLVTSGTFNVANTLSPVPLLYVSDPYGPMIYYMEQGQPFLYKINQDGTFNSAVPIPNGLQPDLAYFDEYTRKILIIARSSSSGLDTSYSQLGNGAIYFCELDPATGLFSSIQTMGAFPSISTIPNDPGLTARILPKEAKMGVYAPIKDGPERYICVALPGHGQIAQMAISKNRGQSWSTYACSSEFIYTGIVLGTIYEYYDVTASCSSVRGNSLEFNFAISGRASDPAFPFGTYNKADAYRLYNVLSNGTTGYPYLRRGNETTLTRPVTSVPWDERKAVVNMCQSKNGAVHAFNILEKRSQTRKAAQVVNLIDDFASSRANASSVFVDDTDMDMAMSTNANSGVVSLVKSSGTSIYSRTLITSVSSPLNWTTFAGDNLSSVAITEAQGATAAAPIVQAGTYLVNTKTATDFTITSVQNPQQDFPTTSVNEQMEWTEIIYTDTVSPNFIGQYLYTSPSVEGIGQANYPPPYCNDLALFRTFGFFANVTQPVNLRMQLLSRPPVGSRLYIGTGGQYLTAGAAEDVRALTYFAPNTGATGLQADIQNTIKSIAHVINLNWPTFRVLCFPVGTGPTQFSSFTLSAFTPTDNISIKSTLADGVTLTTNVFTPNQALGEAKREPANLYYSKTGQSDAVPLLNYVKIGSDTKSILRIIPSRDALFVFKEDGVFIVRGYGPPWQVDPFDLTLKLSIRDSLVTLDNAVFGAFTRGVFKVSDSNVELLSLPIQDRLEQYLVGDYNEKSDMYGFGLADNTDHKYMLSLPRDGDYGEDVWVYDTFTNEWTTWRMPSRSAVSFDDRFIVYAFEETCINAAPTTIGVASGSYPAIFKEKKSLTNNDFYDGKLRRIPSTTAQDNDTVYILDWDPVKGEITIGNLFVPISKYDVILPAVLEASGIGGPSFYAGIMPEQDVTPTPPPVVTFKVLSPSVVSQILTPGQQLTSAYVYRGIPHGWLFAQSFPNSPAATNHFSEFAIGFREAYFGHLKTYFSLPYDQRDVANEEMLSVNFSGEVHFGPNRRANKNKYIRTYIPRKAQRGTVLFCGMETGACGFPIEANGMFIVLTQGPTSFARR
jgi:hypothetical protein